MTFRLMALTACAAIVATSGAALAQPATANADVNVRSGPGTRYESLDRLPAGERVNVLGCDGPWCEISMGRDGTGFVHVEFLDMRGRMSRLSGYEDDRSPAPYGGRVVIRREDSEPMRRGYADRAPRMDDRVANRPSRGDEREMTDPRMRDRQMDDQRSERRPDPDIGDRTGTTSARVSNRNAVPERATNRSAATVDGRRPSSALPAAETPKAAPRTAPADRGDRVGLDKAGADKQN